MRALRRRVTWAMPAVLVAALLSVVALPDAAFASGPSVPPQDTKSTPVQQQTATKPAQDEASKSELHGDQPVNSTTPADGGGKPTATPLKPSATWNVSGQTGDFSWTYPLRVPPAPGGSQPDLSLSYLSSAVDGLTSATNNQSSWVGDGWDLASNYIERTYDSCLDDTTGGTTPPKVGDLCWRSDNAVAVYNNSGGALIRDDKTGVWRNQNDDGSRIEQLFDAGNGDDNGEYWKITTVDGTQYFFGSRPDAKSTWTVPVYGDDAGEPCHQSTFEASHCVQAWRWNLDKVVDRNGNLIYYNYLPETNSYGMDLKDTAVSYIRGGTLQNIQYGFQDGQQPSAQVVFDVADRCVPGSTCTPDHKENWPDVPWDSSCTTATCADRYTPTFWSTKRLAKVTTQVRRDTGMADVDSWTFDEEFPDPGDGEKAALWLKSITHTGLVGGSTALPAVTFQGKAMPNRVYTVGDGLAPLNRYRITGIISESGGVLSVVYAPPDCVGGTSVPKAPETNTMRCFPVRWNKKDFAERTDYFQKYVVAEVTQSDEMSANEEEVTDYQYLDGAAWHYDTSEFTPDDKKTWNEFRGFGRVVITKGTTTDPSGPVTKTEQRFYRGMNGDKLPNGTRSVSVTPTDGDPRPDEDWLNGQLLETITYDGDSDRVVSKEIHDPTWQGPTATRAAYKAYIVRDGATEDYTALAAGGWRTTRTESSYDDRGLVTQVNDLGDTATSADDRCTTTSYDRDSDKWLLNFPSEVKTVGVACTATPSFPGDAVSDTLTDYDANRNATRTRELSGYPATGPTYDTTATKTYDANGRELTSTDALGHTTKTAYTPATGGPTTQTAVTDPGGFTTTTTLDPAWGQPTLVVDANGRRTETGYDALGRTTQVWEPNRAKSNHPTTPSTTFAYTIDSGGLNVVTTTAVNANDDYTTTTEIYDGLMRLRQKQAPAAGGGRLLTDTRYDSQGREYKTTQPYFNDAPVDDKLWVAADVDVPAMTVTKYDGAGRKVADIFQSGSTEKWRTTTSYGGDRVNVTPPSGGTPTTTIADARGQTTELRQYHGDTPSGDYDSTAYTYTDAGKLATVTDPAGNVTKYGYDLRGNTTSTQDVDRGTTTMGYDAAGNLTSSTDARGTTLTYDYDKLNRKTAEKQGSTTLASWAYDTVPFGKGQLASSTRYVDGSAYTNKIDTYTALYQPQQVTVTIPASEGDLAGTYTMATKYKPDGSSVASKDYPAIGDLAEETVSWSYDELGNPLTMSGGMPDLGETDDYVTDTLYTRYGEPARTQFGDDGKRVWQSYYYDDSTRRLIRSIVDAELPQPMQADVHYTYDDNGDITSIANTPLDGTADVQCFRYDYLQRLTEAWTPGNGCTAGPSVSALAGPAPYWQSFTYDKVGNRLTQTTHATTGDTVGTYASTGHRLDSVTTDGKVDKYDYNAEGDTTARPGQQLTWDAEGNLGSVTTSDGKTDFVYDADGTRLIKHDPKGATLYLDGQELRLDKATHNLTGTRYYQYGDDTVAERTGAGVSWLATDHQNTAQISIDSDTMKLTERWQTPFGQSRGTAAPFPGDKGFVGGTIDDSIGLTDLGAREYDPALGRFISTDPVVDTNDPQQMNAYAYSNNNPVTDSDPTGQFSWSGLWNGIKTTVSNAAHVVNDKVGKVLSVAGQVATYAAPVVAVAAAIAGTGPVGVGLAVASFVLGGINIGTDCSAGKRMDCFLDVVGTIPAVGKLAYGGIKAVQSAMAGAGKASKEAQEFAEIGGKNVFKWLAPPKPPSTNDAFAPYMADKLSLFAGSGWAFNTYQQGLCQWQTVFCFPAVHVSVPGEAYAPVQKPTPPPAGIRLGTPYQGPGKWYWPIVATAPVLAPPAAAPAPAPSRPPLNCYQTIPKCV